MSREYDQLAWVDYPETLTPISAANLNRMENGIANLYTDRNKMESNIAYVEEGEEATRHYFINSYLMLNGIFYKTVSEINVGDLLDYGLDGNIEHVDISSQFGSGGGGSTGCVELTQAQYDALSDEAKMLDVIYLITDSPDNYLDEVFGDFATVEYTDTASKAYAVGDYLVYDSKFYRVTSAIAQGDTIVPDTNVVKTTVGEEVAAISAIQASGVIRAVQKSYKSAYNVTTNSELVGALNDMGSNIPIERGLAYYALRTFEMTETSPYLPKGNWACLAFHFNITSFAVLLYGYNYSDIYIYRNVGNTSGNRFIVKFEGTNVRNW